MTAVVTLEGEEKITSSYPLAIGENSTRNAALSGHDHPNGVSVTVLIGAPAPAA
jgi:hypothetical protein